MGLFNLSSVKNHPRRSGFDLSSKVAFTAKVGELLPVKWTLTMPGDKFSLKEQHFTRTQPVNTSAYTRVREYYDWFWCPLHLLWRNAPEVIAQIQQNVQHASSFDGSILLGSNMPCVSLSQLDNLLKNISGKQNYFGFDRADLAYKLIQYLRYGNVQNSVGTPAKNYGTSIPVSQADYTQKRLFNHALSVFPLLAYKKFCQDYFRLTQWQDSAPYLWNIDYYDGKGATTLFPDDFSSSTSYIDNNTVIDMEYCNWNKDLFFGVLPDAQYGDTSVVDISYGTSGIPAVTFGKVQAGQETGLTAPSSTLSVLDSGANLTLDVLALRRGEALQRFREISLCTPMNYRSQIKAHFGVDVGSELSGMSTYIGGEASSLDISEVVNTNITESSEALIAGKGVGTGQSSETFYAKDWGILMCIYHSVPLLDYVISAPDPQLFTSMNTSFPVPELDAIGLESLPLSFYTNSPLELDSGSVEPGVESLTLGYLPRYYAWKTSVDYVLGAFTTTEKEWVAPVTSALWKNMLSPVRLTGPGISYNFFKVNPAILDPIFAVNADSTWDTDMFLVNAAFDIRVARNLDYDGMPY
jgi:hypothetical protein